MNQHLCFKLLSKMVLTKDELSAKIGDRIKEIRKSKNISQAELGRLCEKDKQHIELIDCLLYTSPSPRDA